MDTELLLTASAPSPNNNEAPGPSKFVAQNGGVVDPTKVVMDYSMDFPKLPDAAPGHVVLPGAWGRKPTIQSTLHTEAFELSANERASRGLGKFGNISDEQQKCNQIAQNTDTKIELCEAKDQSLTILITGKRPNVVDARTRLVRELQTQASVEVKVPKEFHGFIIGKEGSKLRSLEQEFICRINMPGRDEKSDTIKIVGPNEQIIEAAKRITNIAEEMAKQGTETLPIPRIFYPWIHQKVDDIISRTGARINIPPSYSKNETIVVTGERKGVEVAAAEIRAIYGQKKDVVKSITCKLPKGQHRLIIGTKRSGLDEILRDTDVVVEVPAEDDDSETITLRGPQDKLANAMALVYAKASSVISQDINYAEWMRRFLIGPKGATLTSLIPKDDKLKVDFEDGGHIHIEGPPESVRSARTALANEIARLEKEMASEKISVPRNLHRHIIGKNGAFVNKMKEENDVQISIPDEKAKSDEIRIEGKKEGVAKVRTLIAEIAKRLENEESKDVKIEHRFHGQIIGKNGANVQKWRQEFPTVTISFPDASKASDVVNVRGDKKEVAKLAKDLVELVKDLELSSFQETVKIDKDCFRHIIGKAGSNINKIRDETQTRIDLPAANGANVEGDEGGIITVIGREDNVKKAIAMLNKIQEQKLRSHKIQIDVPVKFHQRLVGPGGANVRQLSSRHDVQVYIPRSDSGSEQITITGLEENCKKCADEVTKLIDKLVSMVSLETTMDPKFHARLVGQRGRNLRKIEEDFNVEIRMPNRNGPTPELIIISGRDQALIEDCIEKLRVMEEEYMEDYRDSTAYTKQREEPKAEPKQQRSVVMQNAPWQIDNLEQFPSMGGANDGTNGGASQHTAPVSAWGAVRR